jgi:hypothetical protein
MARDAQWRLLPAALSESLFRLPRMQILLLNLTVLVGMLSSFVVGAIYAWSILSRPSMASSNPKRQFRMVDLFSLLFLLGLSFSLVATFTKWYQTEGFGASGNHWPVWADWLLTTLTWLVPVVAVPLAWMSSTKSLESVGVENPLKRFVYTSGLMPITILLSLIIAFFLFLFFRDLEIPWSIPYLVPVGIGSIAGWPILWFISKWCLPTNSR